MDEATRCDRVALVQRGHILAIDTPRAITASFDRPLFAIRAPNRYDTLRALREFAHTQAVYPFGETLHFVDARADVATEQIARELSAFLGERGVADATISTSDPTIEDTFIARMGAPEGEERRRGARD
jgi:ABC-type multidrug transport system ATPase subunit